jgi:hypothetical protein
MSFFQLGEPRKSGCKRPVAPFGLPPTFGLEVLESALARLEGEAACALAAFLRTLHKLT